MYKVKTYDQTSRMDLIWDDEKKQRLSFYVSDFEQPAICELNEAVKQIKSGKLPSYGLTMGIYTNIMNKDGAKIIYNDGLTKSEDMYTLDEMEEMINTYCDEFKKLFNIDLREVTDEYEPLVEGVINPELIENDERIKRFN